ncbi:MAG: PPOX class F420-dependent oxidoreductase [Acidimicrobiales bacterium]
MSLPDEKYVALTTYKMDGSSSSVPVWIADLGEGRVGFTTESESLKVKRVNRDNRVILQPSNSRGHIKDGTEQVSGTATVHPGDSSEYATAKAAIRAKYGWQVPMVQTVYKVRNLFSSNKGEPGDAGIVITLD